MTFVVVAASLLAAFLNAASAVMQRKVAGKPPAKALFRREFIIRLATNKLWLAGLVMQIVAFLLQALALKFGPLTMVEPLMTVDLIFLMALLHFAFNIRPGRREWGAAIVLALGLSGLLITANPHGGHVEFSAVNWIITSGIIATFIAVSIFIVRRSSSGKFRAALAGTAGGINFALVAAFTKLTVEQFNSGWLTVFTSWPIYALIATGLIAIVVTQSTYGAGPIAASQPAIEIADPLVGILIGVLLFGDQVNHDPLAIIAEIASGLLIGAGIILMGGSHKIYESHA